MSTVDELAADGDSEFDHTRPGDPAPVTRLFGWGMLAILAAFLINNVLIVGWDYPGAFAVFTGFTLQALVNLVIYLVCLLAAAYFVLSDPYRSLRRDALGIHRFNSYVIRASFWAVLLCGFADAAIALGRVESLLDGIVGEAMANNLGRAQYVGPNVHVPLIIAGMVIALFSRTLGFHWLALLIVLAELGIVISRFVFSYEQALMGDLVRYWYAALFLFASAYTLFDEGHVRVDVLYAGFGPTTKGFFNAWGSIVLGMTTAWVIIWIGLNGKTSIINSPITNFEVTQSGSTGMYIKYQMAAFLGIFAITMLIQFVSYFLESVADWRDEPGRRTVAPPSH
ncbi:MAG: TRAP transporter small permease subunit [Pseudomonadota bacterium]